MDALQFEMGIPRPRF